MVINRLSMPKHVDHLSRSTGVHLAIRRTSSIRSPPSDKQDAALLICPSLRSHWLSAVGLLQLLACGHHHVMCPSFSLALSRWTAAAPCLWPSPCDTMYPLRTIQNHLVSFSFAKSDMKIKITSEKGLLVLSHRDHPVQNRQLCTPFP